MIESITPIVLGRFSGNCYLVRKDKGFVLVDTGMKNKRKQIEDALRENGCVPGDLDLIILTHADFDHTGNCAYLRELYGAQIAMHEFDAPIVESGDMFVNRKANWFLKILVNRVFGIRTFKPDIALDEGSDLTRFGLDAKILHIPGHSKGSIAILTDGGDLICGDIFSNTDEPKPTNIQEDPAEMEKSIERLMKMEIGMVYPGHGRPFPMSELAK